MTFGELKDALSELPEDLLNREAIASFTDGEHSFTDFDITGVEVGRIQRTHMYMEFAHIKLKKHKLSWPEDLNGIPEENA